MYKNEGTFSQVPINQAGNEQMTNYNNYISFDQDQNGLIKNNNYNKGKDIHKKVKFNNKVEIFNVESYKELNKQLCFNENDELENLKNNEYGYNDFYYKNHLRDSIDKQKDDNSKCCCIIL